MAFIRDARRVFSSMVRTGLANDAGPDGVRRTETELRQLIKDRFGRERVDAWTAHSATQTARQTIETQGKVNGKRRKAFLRKAGKGVSRKQKAFLRGQALAPTPIVSGGGKLLERRRKGLISNEEYREARLLPFVSLGDKTFKGNRHFRLSLDGSAYVFSMLDETRMVERTATKRVGRKTMGVEPKMVVETRTVREHVHRTAVLHLPPMRGRQGTLLKQVAELAAAGSINLQFSLSATHLVVTFDPDDLPNHPERRRPFRFIPGRVAALDGSPTEIGMAVIENVGDPKRLNDVRVIEHALIDVRDATGCGRMQTREVLTGICNAVIDQCRRVGAGRIAVEAGLGHLSSRGPDKVANRLINGWSRTVLLQMLKRKASLAGIEIVEVRGAYSTTVGNVWFELPDACAAACEIARRGLVADPPKKRPRSKAARIAEAQAAKAEKEAAKAGAKAERAANKYSGATASVKRKETLPEFDREDMPPHVADLLAEVERRLELRRRIQDGRTSRGADGTRADLRKEREHGAGTPERRKDGKPSGRVPIGDWTGFHRGIKEAALGVRRPHPGRGDDLRCAVEHLTRRCRPGRVLRVRDPKLRDSPKPVVAEGAHVPEATIRCG